MLGVSEIVASIPALSGVKHYELLNRGVVNEVWRLFADSGSFALRRDTSMARTLGLDRYAEIDVLEVAAQAGLGPVLIWADPEAGLLLTEYIEGSGWGEDDLQNKQNLVRMAKLLKRLHRVPKDSKTLKVANLSNYASHYAQQLATPEAERFADEAANLVEKWCSDSSRQVLCHNDLVCGNIIDAGQGGDLRLIDWEYAGLGEPYFDLAVFLRHHSLSVSASKVFLETYSIQVDEQRLEGCMAAYDRLMVLWLMLVCTGPSIPQGYQAALDAANYRLNH
jgi:thiamine kinase